MENIDELFYHELNKLNINYMTSSKRLEILQ